MTALKQEAFDLIARIPDEKSDVLLDVIKNLREALGINSQSRAERNMSIVEEIHGLIGDDIPWTSEEEMLQELAENSWTVAR